MNINVSAVDRVGSYIKAMTSGPFFHQVITWAHQYSICFDFQSVTPGICLSDNCVTVSITPACSAGCGPITSDSWRV